MLVSHSPLHMCAHTHKYTYVCAHICDIMSREILLQGKSQERTLAGDHGGTKVPWKTRDFLVVRQELLIQNQEI